MLDQQAEQDATNLATETLMDPLTAREKEQELEESEDEDSEKGVF